MGIKGDGDTNSGRYRCGIVWSRAFGESGARSSIPKVHIQDIVWIRSFAGNCFGVGIVREISP